MRKKQTDTLKIRIIDSVLAESPPRSARTCARSLPVNTHMRTKPAIHALTGVRAHVHEGPQIHGIGLPVTVNRCLVPGSSTSRGQATHKHSKSIFPFQSSLGPSSAQSSSISAEGQSKPSYTQSSDTKVLEQKRLCLAPAPL